MKNFKFAMVMFFISIVIAGCSHVQSGMDIEDIPGKAKIVGKLSYNAGQGYSSGKYVQLIQPAANVKVSVLVSNASLSPNNTGKGYTVYEATTDENGSYEVEVPAVQTGIDVTVRPQPFFGTYSEVIGFKNSQPEYDVKEVLFNINEIKISANPGDIKLCDAHYTSKDREYEEALPYTSTFVVNVGEGLFNKTYDSENDSYTIVKAFEKASGKEVIATIDNIHYASSTNANGAATFIIPSKEKSWSTNVTIEVPSYKVNSYTYYKSEYDYENSKSVINKYLIEGGLFNQYEGVQSKTIKFYDIDGVHFEVNVKMVFTPFNNVDTYGYSTNTWSSVNF